MRGLLLDDTTERTMSQQANKQLGSPRTLREGLRIADGRRRRGRLLLVQVASQPLFSFCLVIPRMPDKTLSTDRAPFVLATVLFLAVLAFLLGHTNFTFPSHPLKDLGQTIFGDTLLIDEMQTPKRVVGYFVNWGIYDRKYAPQQIPHQHLTHINYAFANVNKDSGEVVLSDSWADVEIHYEGDSWNDEGTNLYGCLKAIYLLKKQNRNLKVLMSIGGWSYSPNFAGITNPQWRANFVQTAVKLVEDVGLDGLDIDYEYPKTPDDASAYVALLHELRHGLNNLAQSKGKNPGQYQLSVAAPCGSEQMQILRVQEMDQALDFWNLMAYDFAGSWDSVAGHQANLYADDPNANSVDKSVRFYLQAGVHPSKVVVGLPAYGRAFANTNGIGQSYSGTGEGSWEAGMWDYKALPLPGSEEINDHRLGASYSYDANKKLLISYDTQAIAHQKGDYVRHHGLGGVMWWELDADKEEGTGGSLVRTVRDVIGELEQRENELDYPGSKYDNLRKRME